MPQAGCKTGKGVTRSQPKKLGAKKENGRPQASTQNWKMFVPSLLLQYFFQTGALLEFWGHRTYPSRSIKQLHRDFLYVTYQPFQLIPFAVRCHEWSFSVKFSDFSFLCHTCDNRPSRVRVFPSVRPIYSSRLPVLEEAASSPSIAGVAFDIDGVVSTR